MHSSTERTTNTKTIRVFLILYLFVGLLAAQERPPIEIFNPDQYLGQNQNWSIAQIQNKNMCFANNAGLLEYDGTHFSLYQLPNKTAIRSIKVIDQNIFAGGFMDFGFYSRSGTGQLEYTSIKDELNIELLEDEEFWGIEAIDGLVLFQSYNRIYVVNYEAKRVKIIESDSEISKMINYDQDIFIQKKGIGIFKIENEQLLSYLNDEVFGDNRLIGIISYRGKTHYITDNAGIY
ncbi:MAG: LuxR family transcriptional regulator, partial [Bacteroidia bacterium]|nr:LuxR family transcriptional regulator [Bacteroidia bacterium]